MPAKHTKKFGVYHWDTFDNETFLVDEFDTVEESFIEDRYKGRISESGADIVGIVSNGKVLKQFRIR